MNLPTLGLLPNLKAKKISDKQVIITQKFIDGVSEYQKYWLGRVVVFIEEDNAISSNLDNSSINIDELPFRLEIVDFSTIHNHPAFQTLSLVLASVGFEQNHISTICKTYKIPCIYVAEYSLKTRMQVINATTKNPILRLRRYVWEASQEAKQRKAIAAAAGVQCNGTPTYEAYQAINTGPLLYFDTRVTGDMLANNAEVTTRTSQCRTGTPLRLLFSGRLTKIKGADHLILVAQELKKRKVQFEMFICGDGDLKESMQAQIQQRGLSNEIKLLGVLDFKDELIPFVKKNVDLFVCCHRQGDPSCTYLETMGCGVPIVGYANEAFMGVVKYSQVGWFVEMDRPDLLAKQIAELDENRNAIVNASFKSVEFTKRHLFETTFERRVDHLKRYLTESDANILSEIEYSRKSEAQTSRRNKQSIESVGF
jgi:colanic acid/amylovoran biosynthesis glycosyltransferase